MTMTGDLASSLPPPDAPTDDAPTAAPSNAASTRRLELIVQILCIVCGLFTIYVFAAYLVDNRITHIQEVDSQAYFLMAKDFAALRLPRWSDDFSQFHGHPYVDARGGQTMAKYSPGWPLLLAIGYRIAGHDGAMWVNTILGIAAALAIFFFAVELLDSAAAFIAIYILLFSPMFAAYLAYPLAHAADVAVTAIAFWATLRWAKSGRAVWAAAAGLSIGFMPVTCATLVLIWPALALVYGIYAARRNGFFRGVRRGAPIDPVDGLHAAPSPRSWRRIARNHPATIAFFVAFLIPTLFLASYNWLCFGRPWWTGYHLTGEQNAFDFSHFPDRLVEMFQSRLSLLRDSMWIAAVLGITLRIGKSAVAWILVLWFVPIFSLYSGYYFHPPGPVYWRFLLPALPAVALAGGLAVDVGSRLLSAAIVLLGRGRPGKSIFDSRPLGRLAAMLVFALMLNCNPLSQFFLERRFAAAPLRDQPYRHSPVLDEKSDAPTLLFTISDLAPVPDLSTYLRGPTAVYSHGPIYWEASTYPQVDGYDIAAWRAAGYFRPPQNHSPPTEWEVLFDPIRAARLLSVYQSIGPANMPANFIAHVERSLNSRKTVLLIDVSGPTLDWIRNDPTLALESLASASDGTRVYEVKRKAADN